VRWKPASEDISPPAPIPSETSPSVLSPGAFTEPLARPDVGTANSMPPRSHRCRARRSREFPGRAGPSRPRLLRMIRLISSSSDRSRLSSRSAGQPGPPPRPCAGGSRPGGRARHCGGEHGPPQGVGGHRNPARAVARRAGRRPSARGVTCIRLDASVVTCHSEKELAEANFKGFDAGQGAQVSISRVSLVQVVAELSPHRSHNAQQSHRQLPSLISKIQALL
jgi:hypothetical protein